VIVGNLAKHRSHHNGSLHMLVCLIFVEVDRFDF